MGRARATMARFAPRRRASCTTHGFSHVERPPIVGKTVLMHHDRRLPAKHPPEGDVPRFGDPAKDVAVARLVARQREADPLRRREPRGMPGLHQHHAQARLGQPAVREFRQGPASRPRTACRSRAEHDAAPVFSVPGVLESHDGQCGDGENTTRQFIAPWRWPLLGAMPHTVSHEPDVQRIGVTATAFEGIHLPIQCEPI